MVTAFMDLTLTNQADLDLGTHVATLQKAHLTLLVRMPKEKKFA